MITDLRALVAISPPEGPVEVLHVPECDNIPEAVLMLQAERYRELSAEFTQLAFAYRRMAEECDQRRLKNDCS